MFQALGNAVQAALPSATVRWAPTETDRGNYTDPLILLRVISGPSLVDDRPSMAPQTLPTSVTITCTGGPGRAYFAVEGRRYYYDTEAAESAENVRDGLLDVMDRGVGVGTTQISIAEPLVGYAVAGLATSVTNTSAAYYVMAQDAQYVVEVQAYSLNRHPRVGASSTLAVFNAQLNAPTVREILDHGGLALAQNNSPVIDLTALADGRYESRAATSLYVRQRQYASWLFEDPIDAANVVTDVQQ